jgi:hypothetical protein
LIALICANCSFKAAIYSSLLVASNSEIGVSPKKSMFFLTSCTVADLACLVSSFFFFSAFSFSIRSFSFFTSSLIVFN